MSCSIATAANLASLYISAAIPVFLWGAPGVGKSDAVRMIAKARNVPLIDVRAVLLDPVDLRGIPSIVDGVTRWNPPSFLPIAERDGELGILFLDEMNAAPPSTQAALFQLILDRRLGEYRLPDGWQMIAAGNRQSDKAAANRMPSALANRFAHIEIDSSGAEFVDSWLAWADGKAETSLRHDCLSYTASTAIPDEMKAFHAWCKQRGVAMLHNMEGKGDLKAFPTPRSWSQVAKVMAAPDDLRGDLIAGLVGEAATAEFMGFLKVWQTLVPVVVAFANPDAAAIPVEPSGKFAMAAAISRAINHGNFDAACRYLARLSPSFANMAIAEAVARDPSLVNSQTYIGWQVANQSLTI